MGSLARKEITPYSDFEHIILLENSSYAENCMEYFRWFTVIFHLIVLNLQETIIPSLNIEYLNDKTSELGDWFFDTCTSGISFDGMMVHACKFPLGRTQPTKNKPWTTELIKPVDKMLEYLSDEVSLKNGYHLSDILTETCFVYGDQTLHDAFENGIEAYKNSKTREELLDEIKRQVKEDLSSFSTRTKLVNLKPNNKLNIKQMFYRTSTLFITAMGKICGTKSSSCFDIISELAEQQRISENTKHKLSHAVAIACEIRLSMYMKAQSQRDYIPPYEKSETIFDEILKFIEKESIISYFQITYCLQREIIKKLGIKETHIYTNPRLMNITICYALRLDALMLTLMKKQEQLSSSRFYFDNAESEQDNEKRSDVCNYFDRHLAEMETELKSCASILISKQPDFISILDILLKIAFTKSNGNWNENGELATRIIETLHRLSLSVEDSKKVSDHFEIDIASFVRHINMGIATFLIAMNKIDEALLRMNKAIQNVDEAIEHDFPMKGLFFAMAGHNLYAIKEYDKSLTCLQVAVGIFLSDDFHAYGFVDKSHVAMLYAGIGVCLFSLDHYNDSLIYFKIADQMIEDFGKSNFSGFFFLNPALTYHHHGKCLTKLGRSEEAALCFFKALDVTANRNSNAKDETILERDGTDESKFMENERVRARACIFHDLGLLYMKQNRLLKALTFLQESFKLYNDLFDAKCVAEIRVELLVCHIETYQQIRAKKKKDVLRAECTNGI